MKLLLIDIGGTSIKSAIYNGNEYQTSYQLPTDKDNISSSICQQIELYQHELKDIKQILIAACGVIDQNGVVISENGFIKDYLHLNIKALVENKFFIECRVVNDVNAFALKYQHYQHAYAITIGTGLGGAAIVNYNLDYGSSYGAGEIGQIPYKNGIYEDYVSTRALVNKAKHEFNLPVESGIDFFNLVLVENKLASQCLDEYLCDLCHGIKMICCLYNPRLLLIGGAIAAQEKILRPRLDAKLKDELKPIYYDCLDLVFSENNQFDIFDGLLELHKP